MFSPSSTILSPTTKSTPPTTPSITPTTTPTPTPKAGRTLLFSSADLLAPPFANDHARKPSLSTPLSTPLACRKKNMGVIAYSDERSPPVSPGIYCFWRIREANKESQLYIRKLNEKRSQHDHIVRVCFDKTDVVEAAGELVISTNIWAWSPHTGSFTYLYLGKDHEQILKQVDIPKSALYFSHTQWEEAKNAMIWNSEEINEKGSSYKQSELEIDGSLSPGTTFLTLAKKFSDVLELKLSEEDFQHFKEIVADRAPAKKRRSRIGFSSGQFLPGMVPISVSTPPHLSPPDKNDNSSQTSPPFSAIKPTVSDSSSSIKSDISFSIPFSETKVVDSVTMDLASASFSPLPKKDNLISNLSNSVLPERSAPPSVVNESMLFKPRQNPSTENIAPARGCCCIL